MERRFGSHTTRLHYQDQIVQESSNRKRKNISLQEKEITREVDASEFGKRLKELVCNIPKYDDVSLEGQDEFDREAAGLNVDSVASELRRSIDPEQVPLLVLHS